MSDQRPGIQDFIDPLVARDYRESVQRRLERTGVIMQDLRSRAGTLVAAAGVITGLFGQKVLADPDGWITWTAIGLALTMLAAGLWNCLSILAPVKDRGTIPDNLVRPAKRQFWSYLAPRVPFDRPIEWNMGLSEEEFASIGRSVQRENADPHDDQGSHANEADDQRPVRFEMRVAQELEHRRQLNNLTIDSRSRWFEGACWLLLAQIAFWIVAATTQ